MIDRIDRTNAERQRRWRVRRKLEHDQNAALKREGERLRRKIALLKAEIKAAKRNDEENE